MGPRGRGRALDPRGQVLAPPDCRRYALEAIINDIIYLRVHNYVYVPCYNCYGSRVCNNHEARMKTHMHVWNNKR